MKVINIIWDALAIAGALVTTNAIIRHIKFKIGIHHYYKDLYKNTPEKDPKNQRRNERQDN